MIIQDVDVERLYHERINSTSFAQADSPTKNRKITVSHVPQKIESLLREIPKHPFVPSEMAKCDSRCNEIFLIQTAGLAKRMEHTGIEKLVLGISGGLDSTLALLVAVKTMDMMNLPKNIITVTMPGFGTTEKTYQHATGLMNYFGTDIRDIDIKDACMQHFHDIGHDPDIFDVTYENVQARERTQILMNIANKEGGLVVGTGDLSELALGWCTYNGDHMSMYSVNCSIPKTLVKRLVNWFAENNSSPQIAETLKNIVNTPISPELLPSNADGEIEQKTEEIVGPYELHDFFLYYMVRHGAGPEKYCILRKLHLRINMMKKPSKNGFISSTRGFLANNLRDHACQTDQKLERLAFHQEGTGECPVMQV